MKRKLIIYSIIAGSFILLVILVILIVTITVTKKKTPSRKRYSCVQGKCILDSKGKYTDSNCEGKCIVATQFCCNINTGDCQSVPINTCKYNVISDCSRCKIGIPDFLLGAWYEYKNNFTELNKGKCYNLLIKNQPANTRSADNGLKAIKSDIESWRSSGKLFIVSRAFCNGCMNDKDKVDKSESFDQMCDFFTNRPENQKPWVDKIKAMVDFDGVMFNYEPSHVNTQTKYLDCMEKFLKYLSSHQDVYCGARRIIMFSFGPGFIEEDKKGGIQAIQRLKKMIDDNPTLNIIYESQKYIQKNSFNNAVDDFLTYYSGIKNNCILITDQKSFIEQNNNLVKAMKYVKERGIRGLNFWFLDEYSGPAPEGNLADSLINAGQNLC